MKFKEITAEKPLLSLGAAALVIGGACWLTTLYFKTDANAQAIEELRISVNSVAQKQDDLLRSIDTRLSRIEGALDIKRGR